MVDEQSPEPVFGGIVEELALLDDVFSRFTEGADSLEDLAVHVAHQQLQDVDEV